MNRAKRRPTGLALIFSAVLLISAGWLTMRAAENPPELPPAAQRPVDFAEHVEPILHQRCFACHGPSLQMNGLRFDQKEAALKGGYSGPAILPGNSAESPLILRVASAKEGFMMPPAGGSLSAADIGLLRAWIDQGAIWPEQPAKPAVTADKSKQKHWAFQPIQRPEPPNVKQTSWVRNPIDQFILAKLETERVKPSPKADKSTLIRRVSLDLTGLPPTLDEVDEFLNDRSPEAYEHAVDRLLKSPHYGEKWARPWLDLARYADTDGFEKDLSRPYAWRYREWVINALNDDMPFDQFTTWQIAGDLLPNPTAEQMVATGFHRNTLKNREGGVKREQTRFEETVDRANTVGTVWLGLTVQCSQCHDHKYDPITQKDYYSLFAFFDNIEEAHADAPLPGEMGPYLRKRQEYLAKRQELLDQHNVPELQKAWEEKLRVAAKNPGKWTDWDLCYDVIFQMSDGGEKVLWKDPEKRTFRENEILTKYFLEWYHTVVPQERYKELGFKELAKKLEELKESYPQLSQARVIFESPEPHPSYLRVRGDYAREGIEVQPAPPAFLPAFKPEKENQPTRLDLARWIVSRDNPLTARVAVNRMWQELFGRGIVRTSEDFGTQGEPPSHPELLDWLAVEFMDRGWSMKQMHKLMVMSATYRQASHGRPELEERDPENTWLSHQNRLRLPAEAVRDSALRASGLLYPKIGGPSVYPPQPKSVSELTYAWDTERWREDTGPDRYRRGLYIHFQRTAPYPLLINFDAPDSNNAASRRRRSNTPLQALNLLNDPAFMEAAEALAMRVLTEAPAAWDQRLDYAYRLCLSREPSSGERERMARSFERQKTILDQDPAAIDQLAPNPLPDVERLEIAAWTGLSRVLLNLDEFITRE